MTTTERHVILLCNDLMFESRIGANAEAAGTKLSVVRNATQLEARVRELPGARVIVDLDTDGADVIDAVRRGVAAGAQVHAYGSHVAADMLQAAAKAGAHEVMPRSRFVQSLPQLLA